MKLKTVKKRFIKSRKNHSIYSDKAEKIGLEFWRESLKTLKKIFWHDGKFNATPSYMINFCDSTNGVEGVER